MKSKFKNPKKAFKKLIAVFIALVLVSCVAGGWLVFSAVLDRESLFSRDRARDKSANASSAQYSGADAAESAQFGLSAKDVYITSDDGLKLHGYLAENKKSNGKYAIIFHGYTSEGSHMKRYAKHFYKLGYSVLAPDARAHGTSEGEYAEWAGLSARMLFAGRICSFKRIRTAKSFSSAFQWAVQPS